MVAVASADRRRTAASVRPPRDRRTHAAAQRMPLGVPGLGVHRHGRVRRRLVDRTVVAHLPLRSNETGQPRLPLRSHRKRDGDVRTRGDVGSFGCGVPPRCTIAGRAGCSPVVEGADRRRCDAASVCRDAPHRAQGRDRGNGPAITLCIASTPPKRAMAAFAVERPHRRGWTARGGRGIMY